MHSRWPGSMHLVAAGGVGYAARGQERDVGEQPASFSVVGLKPGIKDPAEGALPGAEADHRGVQPNRRLVIGRLPLCVDSRECLEWSSVARAHQVDRRELAPAEGVGDILLGDHRLDRVDA